MVNILTVIAARGGSKGVPRKNLRHLGGVPLITYAIKTALSSEYNSRVIVSTDNAEIAEIAHLEGASVPFCRPSELSGDDVSLIPVAQHAMWFFDEHDWQADIIISLQATAPFTPVKALNDGVRRLLNDPDVHSAVSVALITKHHPFRSYTLVGNNRLLPLTEYTSEKFLQKQDRPHAYGFTAGFYIRRRSLLQAWKEEGFALGESCIGVVVPEHCSVDIDSHIDFYLAEAILANKKEIENKS